MLILERVADLRTRVAEWRGRGERVALVPTLGNLHGGHQSLMSAAAERADHVVVSIFVNPTQFGLGEDYESYPRTMDADIARLRESGVETLFAPLVTEVYPNGHQNSTHVEVPVLSDILCGAMRPGHFRGVATVVCKLLNMVAPDLAVFGEKDWQQLRVIERMVEDLALPVKIAGAATVREPDGLAMSSRNRYLTQTQRQQAPELYRTMQRAAARVQGGETRYANIEAQSTAHLRESGFAPDYFVIRRGVDLLEPGAEDNVEALRILAAAWLGEARLIDNIPVV